MAAAKRAANFYDTFSPRTKNSKLNCGTLCFCAERNGEWMDFLIEKLFSSEKYLIYEFFLHKKTLSGIFASNFSMKV